MSNPMRQMKATAEAHLKRDMNAGASGFAPAMIAPRCVR